MTRRAKMYKQVSVSTASPGELIIMLFTGLVRFVRTAQRAQQANLHHDTAIAIDRAVAILEHLRESLNWSVGGDVASALDTTYAAWMGVLVKANLERDPTRLEAVAEQMTKFAETWRAVQQHQQLALGA
ncbi:MAG: flagellar protein FliS [Myxococcota bacterium]|jgi:flagellar protein FliS